MRERLRLGQRPVKTLQAEAEAEEAGFSWATVRRTADRVNGNLEEGRHEKWVVLEPAAPRRCSEDLEEAEVAHDKTVGTFDTFVADVSTFEHKPPQ